MAEAIKSSIQAGQEAAASGEDDTEEKGPLCAACGNVEDHADHDRTYLKSHDFEPPKSVARAARKSKQKTQEPQSDQSSEIEKGAAMSASSAGD
jgi:hypothetical protein